MYDGKPQLSAFLRVELAADDTALLRRRTQPAAAVYRVCQAVRVIGGLRLITVNEIQLPARGNILEHRSSEAAAPLLRRQNGRPSHMRCGAPSVSTPGMRSTRPGISPSPL